MYKCLIALFVVGCLFGCEPRVAHADTVFLTNGRHFDGIVTEHVETAPEGQGDKRLYRVYFGSTDKKSVEYKGFIDVEKKNVESVEKNDKDSF